MTGRMIRSCAPVVVALCAVMITTTVTAQSSSGTGVKRARPAAHIPVKKEPMNAAVRDTSAVVNETPAPVTMTPPPVYRETRTTPAPMRPRRYGNGFYVGFGGGTGLPAQRIRNGYDGGYAIEVPIGYDVPGSPVGVRANFGYTRFDARNAFRNPSGAFASATTATANPQLWSAMADLKLRVPFFGTLFGPTSGVYAVGGAGVNHFRNYNNSFARTNPEFNGSGVVAPSSESLTRVAMEAGGGISWGFRASQIFLESRYVTAFMPQGRASYVPIVLGVNLF